MIKTILMDVDGVLADFFTPAVLKQPEAADLGYRVPKDLERKYPYGQWDISQTIGITEEQFWSRIDCHDFWAQLRPHDGAREFVKQCNRVKPVAFFTYSSPSSSCASAKVQWLRMHIGPQYAGMILWGPEGAKEILAHQGVLLVDDNLKNVIEFRRAGGRATLVPRPWNSVRRDEGISFRDVDYDKVLDTVKKELACE